MSDKRTRAIINLTDIRKNLDASVKGLPEGVKKLAVVKADAYGHGSLEVSSFIQDDVDFFAVATSEEALALIDGGILKPILILGYVWPEDYLPLISHEVRIPVFSLTQAQDISKAALFCGKDAYVHIKVDSGMHRIGFVPSETSVIDARAVRSMPGIITEGIFTHFCRADEADNSYCVHQYKLFKEFADAVDEGYERIPIRHCANSAVTMYLPEYALDMVRIGISLYGHYPSEDVPKEPLLYPAMTLKSEIVYVKDVEAGEGIGYNHIHTLTEKRKIATIPVGYADGYPRMLSDKAWVLIRGQKAPIVGRICMDMFMCDVTDIAGVSCGDEVTLVGRDGDEEITVEMLGNISGRFNYEFMCDIGKRFKRTYIK